MTTQNDAADKLWQLIERIGVGMLTTRDGDVLRSRPMGAHADQDEGSLWIFAHADDHLNLELEAESDVNMSFVDTESADYVSVSGRSAIVNDRDKAADLWSSNIAAWYSQGLDDPNLRLLRIVLIQGEYWDAESRTMKRLWEIAKANLGGDEPDITEKRKVALN